MYRTSNENTMNRRMSERAKANYPAAQRTGRLAEIWVERFFTHPGWTVGHYQVDDGYDLFVTPPRTEFDGQCFLVQVKGTAQHQKHGVFAPVSRQRLRDYAADITPVLIFRVFVDDDSAYWVHAQKAVTDNPRLALGKGTAQVPIHNCASSFEDFLATARPILLPPHRREEGVKGAVKLREKYLSRLDDTLNVTISHEGDHQTVTIEQVGESASPAGLTVRLSDEDAMAIQDMVHYGQPASVSSEYVQCHGSPLFAELGLDQSQPATLQVTSTYKQECRLRLRADNSQFFGEELLLPAQLTRGSMGFTIETNSAAALAIRVRGFRNKEGNALKLWMDLPPSLFDGEPIALKQGLGIVGQWAERLLAGRRLFGEVSVSNLPIKFSAPCDDADGSLRGLVILGKLHHIARITNSDYKIPLAIKIRNNEASLIKLAYRLFRGEVIDIEVPSAIVDDLTADQNHELADHVIISRAPLYINGQTICILPLRIQLDRYLVEPEGHSGLQKLVRVGDSKSTLSLFTHAE